MPGTSIVKIFSESPQYFISNITYSHSHFNIKLCFAGNFSSNLFLRLSIPIFVAQIAYLVKNIISNDLFVLSRRGRFCGAFSG
jgi:hypothetical protein